MMENIRAQREIIPQAQTPNLLIQLESSPPNLLLNQSQPVLSPLIRRTRVTIKMTAQVLPNQTPRRAARHQRKTRPRRQLLFNLPRATMILDLLRTMVVVLRVVLIQQVALKIQPAGELSYLWCALARSNFVRGSFLTVQICSFLQSLSLQFFKLKVELGTTMVTTKLLR